MRIVVQAGAARGWANDWDFDTIRRIHDACEAIAGPELGLSWYPNQIEMTAGLAGRVPKVAELIGRRTSRYLKPSRGGMVSSTPSGASTTPARRSPGRNWA
jgi:hypothetical protein